MITPGIALMIISAKGDTFRLRRQSPFLLQRLRHLRQLGFLQIDLGRAFRQHIHHLGDLYMQQIVLPLQFVALCQQGVDLRLMGADFGLVFPPHRVLPLPVTALTLLQLPPVRLFQLALCLIMLLSQGLAALRQLPFLVLAAGERLPLVAGWLPPGGHWWVFETWLTPWPRPWGCSTPPWRRPSRGCRDRLHDSGYPCGGNGCLRRCGAFSARFAFALRMRGGPFSVAEGELVAVAQAQGRRINRQSKCFNSEK